MSSIIIASIDNRTCPAPSHPRRAESTAVRASQPADRNRHGNHPRLYRVDRCCSTVGRWQAPAQSKRSGYPLTVDPKEMNMSGFGMQTDPAALFGWVAAVGARNDVLLDNLSGIGDLAV